MKRIAPAVPALLVLTGFAVTLAGVYLLVGLATALIVGGVATAAFGLLADF